MTLDIHRGARPDERFHLEYREPVPHWIGHRRFVRLTWWTGMDGWFVSVVFFNRFQMYLGTGKVDATRTFAYRMGQLGEPSNPDWVVVTTTPSEMWAIRIRSNGVEPVPVWTNMGNS